MKGSESRVSTQGPLSEETEPPLLYLNVFFTISCYFYEWDITKWLASLLIRPECDQLLASQISPNHSLVPDPQLQLQPRIVNKSEKQFLSRPHHKRECHKISKRRQKKLLDIRTSRWKKPGCIGGLLLVCRRKGRGTEFEKVLKLSLDVNSKFGGAERTRRLVPTCCLLKKKDLS